MASKHVLGKMHDIEQTLLQVGLRISKRGEGALFVVGDTKYDALVPQTVPPFDVTINPKLLESLALMDGAVIIDHNGFMKAYGVRIRTTKTLKNFGTRHAAGFSAAVGDNLVVLVSEEDKQIRILKKGKMIMQVDTLKKNVEKSVPEAVNILESIGAGTIGAVGTGLLIPTLGVAMLPGILVFGSVYYIGKRLTKEYKIK
ncbi:MAG: DNA integrity scanning protein DisA nucleotide-binding domain protein [Candidatus Woesearchaeota archaeon]